jgi:type I restriction enzyme R subunit
MNYLAQIEAYHFKDGKLANESKLKEKADYAAYKEATEEPVKKFKFFSAMIKDFKENLMPEIAPLFN